MNIPTPISAAAAPMSVNRLHYINELASAGARVTPFDLNVRAGQLLNEAGDDNDAIAQLRRETASYLIEASHNLRKIERLSRVGGQ